MGTKQLNEFDKHDPFRRAVLKGELFDKAVEQYRQFPYRSVFDYGATDILKKWYDVMGEILGEETTSSCVD